MCLPWVDEFADVSCMN